MSETLIERNAGGYLGFYDPSLFDLPLSLRWRSLPVRVSWWERLARQVNHWIYRRWPGES
jgi:hypothetical protein